MWRYARCDLQMSDDVVTARARQHLRDVAVARFEVRELKQNRRVRIDLDPRLVAIHPMSSTSYERFSVTPPA